jgi:hypothetical protein
VPKAAGIEIGLIDREIERLQARMFAEGGIVRGPGGPKDDAILARLSNGEGVLNAAAVRHYGVGLVNAMNARTARFYGPADGGQENGNAAAGARTVPQASPVGRSGSMSLVLVDDRREARQYIESSEGEAHIMRVVRKNRLHLGIKG